MIDPDYSTVKVPRRNIPGSWFARNLKTAISHPGMCLDYAHYLASKLIHKGIAIRTLPGDIRVSNANGFSEFHALGHFLEPPERQFMEKFSFADGEIVDVGANLGVISLSLARRYPDRKVIAFEPNPTTFKGLCGNIQLNGLTNVTAEQSAVGASDGEVTFNADPHSRGLASISRDGRFVERVRCVSLDSYSVSHGISEIALLKVDVEGYESLVFQGASRLLAGGRIRVIYYEVHPNASTKAGFAPMDATNRLLEAGYQISRLDSVGRLEPVNAESIDQVQSENWIATRA